MYHNTLDKHRKHIRLTQYNYSQPGRYFITICAKNRHTFFGEIQNDSIQLSEIGHIAYSHWKRIPDHFPHVILDAFVVMPDHIHGIIHIHDCNHHPVGTCHGMSLHTKNAFGSPIINSISMMVNHFKGSVTRVCRRHGYLHFQWQPRFYDRVIRTQRELENVRQYIIDNPKNWGK